MIESRFDFWLCVFFVVFFFLTTMTMNLNETRSAIQMENQSTINRWNETCAGVQLLYKAEVIFSSSLFLSFFLYSVQSRKKWLERLHVQWGEQRMAFARNKFVAVCATCVGLCATYLHASSFLHHQLQKLKHTRQLIKTIKNRKRNKWRCKMRKKMYKKNNKLPLLGTYI